MSFDLHEFEDALLEQDKGAMITVDGEVAGFVRRSWSQDERRILVYRAYTHDGKVHTDVGSNKPLEFATQHEAGEIIEKSFRQTKSLKTFGAKA